MALATAVQQERRSLRCQLIVSVGGPQWLDDRKRTIVLLEPFARPLQVVQQIADRSQYERLASLQLGIVGVRRCNRLDQAQCTLIKRQRLRRLVETLAVHVAHAPCDDDEVALRIGVLRVRCSQLLVQLPRLLHQLHAGLGIPGESLGPTVIHVCRCGVGPIERTDLLFLQQAVRQLRAFTPKAQRFGYRALAHQQLAQLHAAAEQLAARLHRRIMFDERAAQA